jgi:hypothetical protein
MLTGMDKAALAIAAVLTLADEVRAHLEHGDLAGLSMILPGSGRRRDAERAAVHVLAELEDCCRVLAEGGVRTSAACWYVLAEQLRATERTTHERR